MVKESFRLLRLNPSEETLSFDFLLSLTPGGEAQFTPHSSEAFLFPTWEDFVKAATVLWLALGPLDIMYEKVFVLSQEGRTRVAAEH